MPDPKESKLPVPKRAVRRSTPSDRVVRLLTKLPLGELTRTAGALAAADRDAAEYFSSKLSDALAKAARE